MGDFIVDMLKQGGPAAVVAIVAYIVLAFKWERVSGKICGVESNLDEHKKESKHCVDERRSEEGRLHGRVTEVDTRISFIEGKLNGHRA